MDLLMKLFDVVDVECYCCFQWVGEGSVEGLVCVVWQCWILLVIGDNDVVWIIVVVEGVKGELVRLVIVCCFVEGY